LNLLNFVLFADSTFHHTPVAAGVVVAAGGVLVVVVVIVSSSLGYEIEDCNNFLNSAAQRARFRETITKAVTNCTFSKLKSRILCPELWDGHMYGYQWIKILLG
jgi:hypothetical protein